MSRARRATRPRRRTVVLDFGGVLSASHDPAPAVHALVGGDLEAVREAIWAHRPPYDRGESTLLEYWSAVAAAAGVEALTEDEALELQDADNRSFLALDPDARALLHDLARAGLPLVLLSNASTGFGEAVRKAEWFEVFSFAVISAEERTMKPEREIYEIVLDALAHENGGVRRPSDAVFFDDREENVAAARALGIDAHHWERNDPARGEGVPNPAVLAARRILADRGVLAD